MSEIDYTDYVKILDSPMFVLLKGDAATGKSPAAGSWPEPYFLDLEGRIGSTIKYWAPKGKKINFTTIINDYPKMMEKLETLERYCPYGTVVLDGFTTLARSLHNLSFNQRGKGNPIARRGEKGERTYTMIGAKNDFKGIPIMEIDEYLVENNGIIQVLDAMRSIWSKGINCICIAHVIEVSSTDLKGNTKFQRRIMTGGKSIAAEIPIYFNEAYHFYVTTLGNREYKIITKTESEDWAKTVLPIPDEINFTDQSLYEILQQHIKDWKKQNVVQANAV